MCSGRFLDYGVAPEEFGRPALLKEYELLFNKESRKDGSGKANVQPRADGEVWGVLYTIPDKHLDILDNGEGSGYYREKMVVYLTDDTVTEAWVYLAREPSNDPLLRPYTWYKRFLVEGAREHELPTQYIEKLERIDAKEDENQERDREKRSLTCRG